MTAGPGLCASCRHARRLTNRRGSEFWLCERSRFDARFPRYPPLPVARCAGYETAQPIRAQSHVARADDRVARRGALYGLIYAALVLAIGHHVDHVIRGNQVGWPVTGEINAFTYSLGIYPAIITGLLLYRRGIVGPGFWIFLSGGGAAFLAAIHFGPWAIEPPQDIIGPYEPAILGWLAFGWLLALVGVLVASTAYELRMWLAERRRASGSA